VGKKSGKAIDFLLLLARLPNFELPLMSSQPKITLICGDAPAHPRKMRDREVRLD